MITLSKSGNTITFTFDENSGYLQNGTIDVPVNSLSLVIDDSDMATFRKSASNDIFISARYEEFGMTKAELEAWYKDNMVSSGGGGGGGVTSGEVQTMIDSSISGLAESSAVTEEISEAVSGKVDTTTYTAYTASTDTVLSAKADTTAVTQSISEATSGKVDTSTFETYSGSVETALSAKADTTAVTETITEATSGKVDTTAYTAYTAATDAVLSGKQDTLSAGTNITIVDNVISAEGGGKAVAAGTNISITTGETADTINCTLRAANTSGTGSMKLAFLNATDATGVYSVATGYDCKAKGSYSFASGRGNNANNYGECAVGFNNKSVGNSTSISKNSGCTLFSVGNGQGTNATSLHNAFEVRQNGDIYITLNDQDVKLQDQLGGGGQSCTVDETTIYDKYESNYASYGKKVTSVVIDFLGDKTSAIASYYIAIFDDSFNSYFNQYVNFDYPNGTYTLSDESQAEYIDIEYDSTIEDFKFTVASSIQSVAYFYEISNVQGYILVPFYTIESGSPCTVIENDIVNVVEQTRETLLTSLSNININSTDNSIILTSYSNKGSSPSTPSISLEEIDGSDNTLKPNIYIPLGTSGWIEISYQQGQYDISNLSSTKMRITYDSNYDMTTNGTNLLIYVYYGSNILYDQPLYDSMNDIVYSNEAASIFSTAATYEWSSSTKELVITYPSTVEYQSETLNVYVGQVIFNGQLGYGITKFETYGELKQPLKPYVQETKAALGGLKLQQITQSDYDNLQNKDASTLYVIVN